MQWKKDVCLEPELEAVIITLIYSKTKMSSIPRHSYCCDYFLIDVNDFGMVLLITSVFFIASILLCYKCATWPFYSSSSQANELLKSHLCDASHDDAYM